MPSITTFLMFNDQADAASRLYTSLFDGRITSTSPGPGGIMSASFELFGRSFVAFNGGPSFQFAEGMSILVSCDTQAEIDRFWAGLTADGGKEGQCGWLTDRFGVSWQIVPTALPSLLGSADREKGGRALQAMLKMQKLDLAALQRAHDGN